MTEYWKSNPRKFCDYCKCWFADNRPSIDFHESGKKHKENVTKKLREIGKRGQEDYQNSLRMDEFMAEMETGALKAYKDDIGSNPDMTGTAIADIAKEKNAVIVLKCERVTKPPEKTAPSTSKWYEAKSSDGHPYYFHTESKETRWEAPPEGFLSIDEQKHLKEHLKEKKKSKKKKAPDTDTPATQASAAEEGKVKKHKTTDKEEQQSIAAVVTPQQRLKGYGTWTTVEKPIMPDLQLPTVSGMEDYEDFDYSSLPKTVPHQFTQKTVTLGEAAIGTGFKKRKNCDNNKRNARQRNDDL